MNLQIVCPLFFHSPLKGFYFNDKNIFKTKLHQEIKVFS